LRRPLCASFASLNSLEIPRTCMYICWRLRLQRGATELMELLLTDGRADIEVVAREPRLRDGMHERLRRALDRVACAQSLLETISEIARQESRRGRNIANWKRGRARPGNNCSGDAGDGGIAGKGVAGRLSGRGGGVAGFGESRAIANTLRTERFSPIGTVCRPPRKRGRLN
jgi:hypothetical protein